MSRKYALISAGVFTGMIMIAGILLLSFFSDVRANDVPEFLPTAAEMPEITEQTSDFEAALAARGAALTEQLAQRQMALTKLDETYKEQFAVLEGRLEYANAQTASASERVEVLQRQVENIQAEIAAADQAFQEEMTGIQNSLIYQDSQIRQEIEIVYAQLQQAYEQIAAQEALAMGDGGGSGDGSSTGAGSDDDYDDHDDDHDEDEYDDDHDDDHDGDHEGDDHDDD